MSYKTLNIASPVNCVGNEGMSIKTVSKEKHHNFYENNSKVIDINDGKTVIIKLYYA